MKKIILKGNEIEIFKDSHESYFDKFMIIIFPSKILVSISFDPSK